MKNKDNISNEFVHLFIALRRKKDNPNMDQLCLREIIGQDESLSLKLLEKKVENLGGTWRIHKTINKRSTHKAMNLLHHNLIDNPIKIAEKFVSEWKTSLMRRESKAERNILLDIDSQEAYAKVDKIIEENNIQIINEINSPNGCHIVINGESTDTRLFENIDDLEFKRDGYIFVKLIYSELT